MMERIVRALAIPIVLCKLAGAAAHAASANEYPNYYAARRALDRGDCDATVDYLTAFLRNHPYVKEKYPGFYLELKRVMGRCTGTIRASGIGGDASDIDPLPDDPPMDE